MIDLDELERLAKAATPGPWSVCRHLQSVEADEACMCGYRGVVYGPEHDVPMAICQPGHDAEPEGEEGLGPQNYERAIQIANGQHIAAANPATILTLTAEVRRLRAENEALALARLSGDAPKRAVTLELEMQADEPRELATALYNFATQIDRNEVSRSGVSGSYHAGYTYTYAVNDAPSHEEYFAAVDVWLAARKAAKEGV
jgi:hypothetical protein